MSKCTIVVRNVEAGETRMLEVCLARCARWIGSRSINVYVKSPESDGFLEYAMAIELESGQRITIVARRRPGSTEIEFHS
jgi:hypothetical protein